MPLEVIADRYRVARRLGVGGMARVYLCHDDRLDLWCAIKVMSADTVRDPVQRARFVQEARTLARLQHPHLVRLYDLVHAVECPYMVMEYLEGGTVANRLTRGVLHPALAARLVADVANALQAAHDAGVVHRDIKPQNLLLDGEGAVKVSDFGVARVEQEQLRLTQSNVSLGTLAYMPPEQQRDASKVDLRADVYAAAATLYTLLTGRRPTQLCTADRDRALRLIEEPLRGIVDRGTRPQRRDRYDSARALEQALRQALPTLPDPIGADPVADRRQPPPTLPPEPGWAGLLEGELDGTARPWQGPAIGSLPPEPVRQDTIDTGAETEEDEAPGPSAETASLPPRRRWWFPLLLAAITLGCAGACTGLGLASSLGAWWAVGG